MTRPTRSLVVLLIAVSMAAVLAVPSAYAKAEAAVAMVSMTMGADGPECPRNDSQTDLTTGCDLLCGLSIIGILADPATPALAPSVWRFDMVATTASGQGPPPALAPPRTNSLL